MQHMPLFNHLHWSIELVQGSLTAEFDECEPVPPKSLCYDEMLNIAWSVEVSKAMTGSQPKIWQRWKSVLSSYFT